MKRTALISIIAASTLTACAGVSTGVRSPCFGDNSVVVTRGLSFMSVAPVNQTSEASNGCDFEDL